MSILGISILIGGMGIYGYLNGGFNDEPLFKQEEEQIKSLYDETYDYLINLTYEELFEFIQSNEILKRYEHQIHNDVDMSDKHQLVKYISKIALIEKRPFNNKYILY